VLYRAGRIWRCVVLSGAALAIVSFVDRGWGQTAEFDRTELISVNSAAEQGDRDSFSPSISSDGRMVAFASRATDLVPRDRNNSEDVFVHDRQTGETVLVSVSSGGAQGNDDSYRPAIAGNGRYVVFQSDAANLVSGDDNGVTDIFLHDLLSGRTTRVSVGAQGEQGDGASLNPSISDDGRVIAFHSYAGNLDAGDTNRDRDVFVHERGSGQTNRIRGRSPARGGVATAWDASISGDGRYVAFSGAEVGTVGDLSATDGIFVFDRATAQVSRVSINSAGAAGDRDSFAASISAQGRFVAFASDASNLVDDDANERTDVFVHDRQSGQTLRVSVDSERGQTVGDSHAPAISSDGRHVAYWSRARDLVDGDRNERHDVFVHDRRTGQTRRLSVSSSGRQSNGHSESPAISADGRFLAFESSASNLVLCDRNERDDVFVHGPSSCAGRLVGDANGDGAVNPRDADAFVIAVTDPCRYQAEFSHCDLLCNNDINGDGDVDFFDIAEFIDLVYDR
jgi:Tol biopolymer transport system component